MNLGHGAKAEAPSAPPLREQWENWQEPPIVQFCHLAGVKWGFTKSQQRKSAIARLGLKGSNLNRAVKRCS